MKLTAREDIFAPTDAVFEQLVDARALEHGVLRRGLDLKRSNNGDQLTEGEELSTTFRFRGRKRDISGRIREMRRPEHIVFDARTGGMELVSVVNLVPLSPQHTRIDLTINLKPKTLSARLLVQSLKLTRSTVDRKMKRRLREFAKTLEKRATA